MIFAAWCQGSLSSEALLATQAVSVQICADTAWGANKASLESEPWHQAGKILHARIDLPTENNSPTVAGVKTELLLYHFIDGKLFRITAKLPTDQFHLVSEAAIKKYGPVTRETQKPRQLIWENPLATVILTRGTVHPREASVLELIHKQLDELASTRARAPPPISRLTSWSSCHSERSEESRSPRVARRHTQHCNLRRHRDQAFSISLQHLAAPN